MTNNILFGSSLWQKDMLDKILEKVKVGITLDDIEEVFIDVQGNLYNYPLRELINRMVKRKLEVGK